MNWQCNSTEILLLQLLLIVSIKFEELTRKKNVFQILRITFFFGVGNNKLYS